MDPSPFDDLLISFGSGIMRARAGFLEEVGTSGGRFYGRISGGEDFGVEYQPKVALEAGVRALGDIKAVVAEQLRVNQTKETVMKTCLVGPHRDEVAFSIAGRPARTHGSQGQWRTAAVSLKLAVYELLKSRRDSPPILLLDEIFAELDVNRSRQLMELFSGAEQLFLTTATEPSIDLNGGARKFRVAGGTIEDIV
jgi:DNA replication and repair protein RecF